MTEQGHTRAELSRRLLVSPSRAIAVRIILGVFGAAMLIAGALMQVGAGIVCLAVMGVLLIIGWPRLLGLPHPTSTRVVMSLIIVIALGVANWGEPKLMAFVIALSVIAVFLSQMIRGDGRAHLLEQASGTFVGSALCIMLTLWNYTWCSDIGRNTAVVFAVVICVVAVIESVQTRTSHVVAFINAVVVGLLLAWIGDLHMWAGAAIGISVVMCYILISHTMREAHSFQLSAAISRSMIPLCLMGAAAYAASFLVV